MATAGPAVNYTRITAAVDQHKDEVARAQAITDMQTLVDGGAKAFLSVEGYVGRAIEVPAVKAQQLLAIASQAADASAAALGAKLVELTQGLPP